MTKGKVCLVISAVIYGISPLLAVAAYQGGINGLTLTFLRSALSIPLLYVIIKADKRKMKLSGSLIKSIIILSIFGGALPILLLYSSYDYIDTGLATTLHFVYPIVIVFAAAAIYHEKISRVMMTAVVFVTVGVFMFSDISSGGSKTGVILALLSGIFYSFYVIYIERSGLDRLDYVVLTFYVMIIMSISIFIFGIAVHGLSFHIKPVSWAFAGVISLMVTLGAMPLFQIGVRYVGAEAAGIVSTLEPITSVVAGAVFLGESVGMSQIFGGALILFGVLLSRKKQTVK